MLNFLIAFGFYVLEAAVIEHDVSKKWSLPINYKFDGTHSSVEQSQIRRGIQHWESRTCITFKEIDQNADPEKNHIIFTKGKGCWSYIGSRYRNQTISVGNGCFQVGITVHDIGHALGLFHEQNRHDRDAYIKINRDNMRSTFLHNVKKIGADELTYGTPYDYASIMHHGQMFFSTNKRKTIEPKDPAYSTNTIGQRIGLSFTDAMVINIHYCSRECGTRCSKGLSITPADVCSPFQLGNDVCQHNGYQDPKDCSRCRCPEGWSGRYCEKLAIGSPQSCGGIVNLSSGQSGRDWTWPSGKMPAGQKCAWIYKAVGQRVTIHIRSFGGLRCGHAGSCNDWIEVRTGTRHDVSGPRLCYCDGSVTDKITSQGQEIMVLLKTTSNREMVAPVIDFSATWGIDDGGIKATEEDDVKWIYITIVSSSVIVLLVVALLIVIFKCRRRNNGAATAKERNGDTTTARPSTTHYFEELRTQSNNNNQHQNGNVADREYYDGYEELPDAATYIEPEYEAVNYRVSQKNV